MSYIPFSYPCPPLLVRTFTPQSQSLNVLEAVYIAARESSVIPPAWSDWLGDYSDIGYNASLFDRYPRIGVALGGHGLRAALFGAAVLSAFDARNATAKLNRTGGLLQVASYLAASSGGSWLTTSLVLNDWPSLSSLVYGDDALSGWTLDLDIVAPSDNNKDKQAYWSSILATVEAKANASFDTSLTDVWGRALSYHFLNQTTRNNFYANDSHGAGQLWSQVPLLPSYANQSVPFPIITADALPSGTSTSLNATVYEFTPIEFGSWDPSLSAMAQMSYAGTNLVNGLVPNGSTCVSGFDQASFIMGTSASIFNTKNGPHGSFPGFDDQNGDADGIRFLYQQLASNVHSRSLDVANWPNAFQGINPATFQDSSSQSLSLVDGGSNLEQVPLGALFANARAVDVVVAVDASADDSNQWPNGTTLLTTSRRISSLLSSSHQAFPPIPSSAHDFNATGVNQRPTFFGCDPKNVPAEYPLIIYIPNSPPFNGDPPASNTGDFQLSYTHLSTAVFINQAFNNALSGFTPNDNATKLQWGQCLQCAALDRARLSLTQPLPRSPLCTECFLRYCYDPNNPPSVNELPSRNFVYTNPDPSGLTGVEDFLKRQKGAIIGGAIAVAFLIGGGIALIFWWRRRRERKNRYSRVDELRDDDEPWKFYDSYSPEHELDRLDRLSLY